MPALEASTIVAIVAASRSAAELMNIIARTIDPEQPDPTPEEIERASIRAGQAHVSLQSTLQEIIDKENDAQ